MTTNGILVNSKKGIKVEVSITKGIGKGEGKEFVTILFSEKPSQTILDSLKLKNFHYFKATNTWSAYKTEYSEKFALSLIKENKEAEKTEETEADKKPSTSSKGKAEKEPTMKQLLAQILENQKRMQEEIDDLKKSKSKKK